MDLSPVEKSCLRKYFSRNNRILRIVAWIIIFLVLILSAIIILAYVKSSFSINILFIGAIGLVLPLYLIRFLLLYSGTPDIPNEKEKIAGKIQIKKVGFRMPETVCHIDEQRVIFPYNWEQSGNINDGEYIEAWGVPMMLQGINPARTFLIIYIKGKFNFAENSTSGDIVQ